MKDLQLEPMSRPDACTTRVAERRRAYRRPEVTTHDAESILRQIGPAHGVYGAVPGTDDSL